MAILEDQLVQAKLISEEVDRKLVLIEQDLVTQQGKAVYNVHQHDNTHYAVEDVVGMRRAPNSIGESTKLPDKNRGQSSDVCGVLELDATKGSRFATTVHISKLILPADDEAEG